MPDQLVSHRLPARERREVIVEAAGPLFGERGYGGVRLDDVAAAAGVTKPVLYRHFDSKDALYLALLERHRADLPMFTREVPGDASPEEVLRIVLDAWLAYVEDHTYAWKMLFRDTGGGAAIAAVRLDVQKRARQVMAEIIRSLNRVGIAEREIAPLAELMRAGMASLVLWWFDNPQVTRETLIEAMARVWRGLLVPSEAGG